MLKRHGNNRNLLNYSEFLVAFSEKLTPVYNVILFDLKIERMKKLVLH